MIFKIKDDEHWFMRGWTVCHNVMRGLYFHKPTTWVTPEWYGCKATVICPSMLEGWDKKFLTARQV